MAAMVGWGSVLGSVSAENPISAISMDGVALGRRAFLQPLDRCHHPLPQRASADLAGGQIVVLIQPRQPDGDEA
jgi:hypothetical protein